MVNKADVADPLGGGEGGGGRPGGGLPVGETVIEHRLPRPPVEMEALVPYDKGELVSRMHRTGGGAVRGPRAGRPVPGSGASCVARVYPTADPVPAAGQALELYAVS